MGLALWRSWEQVVSSVCSVLGLGDAGKQLDKSYRRLLQGAARFRTFLNPTRRESVEASSLRAERRRETFWRHIQVQIFECLDHHKISKKRNGGFSCLRSGWLPAARAVWAATSLKLCSHQAIACVATARDPRRLEDLVEKYGDRVRTAPLDVADEDAAYAAVQVAVDAFARLDVVVNNAGYGDVAPFEQLSSQRFKAVVDTNFYAVVNVTRSALPIMRKQKSGCILQISSVGGRLALPGSTPYHAAKWAVGGFTESLAQEVAPFGVKVCALEPGGMRTNWGVRANKETPEFTSGLPAVRWCGGQSRWSLFGGMRIATRPKSLRSFFVWLPATICRRISCWAAMPSGTLAKRRRRAQPMQSAGAKLVSPQTWTLRDLCLLCDSERLRVPSVNRTGRPYELTAKFGDF